MTLSAAALAGLILPAGSSASAFDSKDPAKVTATNLFKNVFDSLTEFEDLEGQGSAKQDSETVPAAFAKKDPPSDTESAAEAMLVPQGVRSAPAKLSLVASRIADSALIPSPEHPEADSVAGAQLTEPDVQSGTLQSAIPAQSAMPTQVARVDDAIAKVMAGKSASLELVAAITDQAQPQGAQGGSALTGTRSVSTLLAAQAAPSLRSPSTVAAPAAQSTKLVSAPVSKTAQSPAPPASGPFVAAASSPNTTTATIVSTAKAPVAANPAPAEKALKTTVRGGVAESEPKPDKVPGDERSQKSAPRRPQIAAETLDLPAPRSKAASVAAKSASTTRDAIVPAPQPRNGQQSQPRSDPKTTAAPNLASFSGSAKYGPIVGSMATAPQVSFADAHPNPLADSASSPSVAGNAAPAQSTAVPVVTSSTSAPASSSSSSSPAPSSGPSSSAPSPSAPSTAAPVSTISTPPTPLPASAAVDIIPTTPALNRESSQLPVPAPQREAFAATPAPRTPLLPQAENLAFEVRMLAPDASWSHAATLATPVQSRPLASTPESPAASIRTQVEPQSQSSPAPQLHTTQNPQSNDSQRETTASSAQVPSDKTSPSARIQPELLEPQKPVSVHSDNAPFFETAQTRAVESGFEVSERTQTSEVAAPQDAHLLTAELPKPAAGSEILLHLTDGDQAAAAIRVADRAGAVNVSVHASDPVLRESLRSNLGELTTQLNQEGWKTDVVRSAVVAHSDGRQDPQSGGQRGNPQQQSSASDRQQQQRDRRGSGQWQQELEHQISGGDDRPGGNR